MHSRIRHPLIAYSRIPHWLGPNLLLCLVLGQAAAEESLPNLAQLSDPLLSVVPEELNPAMASWIEDFQGRYPGVEVRHQTGDSLAASAALAGGLAHLAVMNRPMSQTELDTFAARHGYRPTPLRIGLDAVRILVHRDNPLPGLTLQELAAVFSQDRQCGAARRIVEWGQLTAMSLWRGRPIQLLGGTAGSDMRTYFREHVLCNGEFRLEMRMLPDSQTLLRAIGDSQNALGYTNLTGGDAQVRPVPLSRRAGNPFIEPSSANVLNGAYPLSHYLYVYFDKSPQGAVQPMVKGFLSLILSPQGQTGLAQSGLIPLPSSVATEEMRKLD